MVVAKSELAVCVGFAMAMAEVEATIVAVRTIAAALRPLGLAVIINAGTRLTEDASTVLIPFADFCENNYSVYCFPPLAPLLARS